MSKQCLNTRWRAVFLALLLIAGTIPAKGAMRRSISERADIEQLESLQSYIRIAWRKLTRSNAGLAKAAVDPKFPVSGRAPVYVARDENFEDVAEKLRREMGESEFSRIDLRRLPANQSDISEQGLLYLPYPYVVPGGRFNEMYGWDSYFIQVGLLRNQEVRLAKNMTDNFLYEIAHYGKIPAIALHGVTKSFGEQKVLDSVDLEVRRGETLAVLGRSGTGKSVTLKLIIGLQKVDSGQIEISGEEITELPIDELNRIRKTVGFLFQQGALFDSFTVEENVAFPMRRHRPERAEERVHELLARVGMDRSSKKMPTDLSGGMRKRVALARALALDPQIMLLDEPTAGLDPITSGEINDLIRELQSERQMSSIIVTHDMSSVRSVADRVALLNESGVVFNGTMEQMTRSDHPFVTKFLKASGEVSRCRAIHVSERSSWRR